ncbi:hypothetical protein AYO38_07080 [bacterium SCGC AG-212-C10]|nr:hypothetical protein AYO38_07080 [bacterium SCGC AG-212-C10]
MRGHSDSDFGIYADTDTGFAAIFGDGEATRHGLFGQTASPSESAIFARNLGSGPAIQGIADHVTAGQADGAGLFGSSGGTETPLTTTGVQGSAFGTGAHGVYGHAIGVLAVGLGGAAEGTGSVGVRGDGAELGVGGYSSLGDGVYGNSTSGNGTKGRSFSGSGAAGISLFGYGVYGTTDSGFAGVWGRSNVSPLGDENVGTGANGVYGQGYNSSGSVVFARNESSGAGVTAYSVSGLAGNFLGPITVGSCSGCAAPSDARLKRDIIALAYGLDAIARLQPVEFAYINAIYGQGQHLGFLAQDVQKVLPELVTENADDEYLRVDYDGIIPVLVRGMQEQQAQIDALRVAIESNSRRFNEGSGGAFAAPNDSSSNTALTALALAAGALAVLCAAIVSKRSK